MPNPIFKQTEAQKKLCSLASRGNATRIMAFGGSRSGKTFEICREICAMALSVGGRYAIFRKTFNSAKTSIFTDTLPKVFKLCWPKASVEFNRSDFVVKIPSTEAEIWILGLDDAERVEKVLGKEFAVIYFNECSEIAYRSVEIALTRLSQRVEGLRKNIAYFDCNPPTKSHWTYKLFVEKKNPVTNAPLVNPGSFESIRINPVDNAENLPKGYIEDTLAGLSRKQYERFALGIWGDDNENALWKASTMIDPYRLLPSEAPEIYSRIVVGVDPAVTNSENSDKTGIVVVGQAKNGAVESFYILEDATILGSPEQWAKRVDETFRKWRADRVVVETNQGGDLVVSTLRNVAPYIPIKKVRATRGKLLRAEPVAALSEAGRVFFVGVFPELEDQMTSYVGDSTKSPDNLDAYVWAVTELTEGEASFTTGEFSMI